MSEDQFSAMLAIIVPPVIEQIMRNSNVDAFISPGSIRSFRMKRPSCGIMAP